MNVNYSLAKEIYGATPWCVDATSLPILLSVLRDARNGVTIATGDVKNNTPFLAIKNDSRIVTEPYELRNQDEEFDAIGVIQIDGPITNTGGASSYGMLQLSSMMLKMANDKRVKSFIIYADSGGGSAFAVETMQNAIMQVRESGKKVIGLVRRGGMACSAMYMILSACESIYVESEMSLVGSNGTMISFSGFPANHTTPEGEKHIEVYATKSTEKNIDFREALNNDNYKLLVDNMLDPMNERALNRVLENRPQLEGTNWDTGISIFAKDGIGTYVDGVKSFDELVEELNLKINYNMTSEQLKQEHPDVYASIIGIGVAQERERVGSWLAHHETDSKIVLEGIESGAEIGPATREKLLVKATANNRFEKLENATNTVVTQPESETPPATPKEDTNPIADVVAEAMKKVV